MIETRTGNTLSTSSAPAATFYQEAIDLILSSESGAAETLNKALQLDENFSLAAAARYFVAKDIGESGADIYRDTALASSLNITAWERDHVNILIGMIDQPSETQAKARTYIENTPNDILVISQLASYKFFYGGANKLASVLNLFESVEEALSNDWAFLTRLGFAASEVGQRMRGRELIERALQMRPQSLYGIHALAHVLHDDSAAEESSKLLQEWLKKYGSNAMQGQMYGHVQWHLALSDWQIGDRESAMKRYQKFCTPETTTCGPILTLADCGGFLLRDYIQSGKTRRLDAHVLKSIDRFWGMIGHPFIALHVAGLYASAGDMAGLLKCKENISTKPRGENRDVSLALVSALKNYVKSNYQQAAQTLATISKDARVGIGGSNVERILVELLEESCLSHSSRV